MLKVQLNLHTDFTTIHAEQVGQSRSKSRRLKLTMTVSATPTTCNGHDDDNNASTYDDGDDVFAFLRLNKGNIFQSQ
ncbi:hypothetical protein EG68_11954 [Paragonimus skrjabini miyazakii]|uniref:Uncharacterized protein n=1 Tax=Paragonimus skrjabini miyazakii TaxID=59628 RepID=A0A8S9Y9E4_9TREM|nr:hypothetical protein EG68_11954 [Paragonimus skrjabini miyazakii]